jgi:hypothetical protein
MSIMSVPPRAHLNPADLQCRTMVSFLRRTLSVGNFAPVVTMRCVHFSHIMLHIRQRHSCATEYKRLTAQANQADNGVQRPVLHS